MGKKSCVICGAEFSTYRKSSRYCSRACRDAAITTLPVCVCAFCEKEFRPKKSVQQYCSKRCGRLANVKPPTAFQVSMFRVCHCGTVFVKRQGKVQCSACQDKETRVKNSQRGYARRAVTALYVAERIDPIEIAERDGWRCGLCGEAVTPGLKWPNPDALSLDHILPISKGGRHTPDNVQLSHLRCNWSKGKGRGKWRTTAQVRG